MARRSSQAILGALVFVVLATPAMGQETPLSAAMVDDPCSALPPTPPAVQAFNEAFISTAPLNMPAMVALTQDAEFKAYDAAKKARQARDWPGLCAYREDNARVIASGVRPDVVMMGDSITENWARADPQLIDGVRIIGRGISGQTSAQMLVRFRADVIALRPRIVHILAGTNDIAGNAGPTSPDAYRNAIMSMTDLARANGIEVVLASISPASRFFWRPDLHPAEQIAELNDWLRDYAAQSGVGFVDYYPALVNGAGGLRGEYGIDGVHPNRDGYAAMLAPLRDGLK